MAILACGIALAALSAARAASCGDIPIPSTATQVECQVRGNEVQVQYTLPDGTQCQAQKRPGQHIQGECG